MDATGDVSELLMRVYAGGRLVGKTGKRFESLDALSTTANLRTIENLMKQTVAEHTLEVGFAYAGSAITFAAMHKRLQGDGKCRHTAIDPYQKTVWDSVGYMKLSEVGLSQYVEVIEQQSSVALPRLMSEGRRFGIIYIDGSHLFEDVFVDMYYSLRMLEEGGYVLFDDSTDPHVRKVLNFIRASIPGMQLQAEVTLRQRIARLFGRRQLTVYRRAGSVQRAWDADFCEF